MNVGVPVFEGSILSSHSIVILDGQIIVGAKRLLLKLIIFNDLLF